MKFVPPRGERLLPLLSGILLVLSFPPFQLLVPPFIALVPLLVFVASRPNGREARWSAGRAGFLAGLVYFGLLLYWLIVALIYYSALAIPAYALTVLILAAFTALFAAAVHLTRERIGLPLLLSAPIFWTTLEWVQGNLGDLSFPWLGLGSSLTGFPVLAGAADLIGARGLSFVMVLINALVAETVLRLGWGTSQARHEIGGRAAGASGRLSMTVAWRPAVAAFAIVAGMALYGWYRASTLELRPAATAAVVQPNIPEDLKMEEQAGLDSSWTALTNLTAALDPGSADLVAWPEVALTVVLRRPYLRAMQRDIERLSTRADAPILLGVYEEAPAETERTVYLNAAVVVDQSGLDERGYGKRFLVPFVERVPFIDPAWLESLIGDVAYFGGLGKGQGLPLYEAGGAQYGVLICYESIFAGLSRDYRRAGADFLVNITNDAWYGREAWYARTTALWQHPAHLVMRAIEQRVGIARAANTGISMFVDPLGRTYEETELFEATTRTAPVYTTDSVTLYARFGDWLATLSAISALLLLTYARMRRPG